MLKTLIILLFFPLLQRINASMRRVDRSVSASSCSVANSLHVLKHVFPHIGVLFLPSRMSHNNPLHAHLHQRRRTCTGSMLSGWRRSFPLSCRRLYEARLNLTDHFHNTHGRGPSPPLCLPPSVFYCNRMKMAAAAEEIPGALRARLSVNVSLPSVVSSPTLHGSSVPPVEITSTPTLSLYGT